MNNNFPVHIVAVSGIVLDEENKMLMIKHNRYGWVFPGGQVEEGEDIIIALKREILEETGIQIRVEELFCVSSNVGKHKGYDGISEVPTKVIFDFICRKEGGTLKSSEENSKSIFIEKNKVFDLITKPSYKQRFQTYLDYHGRPTFLSYVSSNDFKLNTKRLI